MFLPPRPMAVGTCTLCVEPVSEHEAGPLGRAVRGTPSLQGLSSLSFAVLAPFSVSEEHSESSACAWCGHFFSCVSAPRRSQSGFEEEKRLKPALQAFA